MSLFLIAAVALLYGANQYFFKEFSDSILVHWYLNDVLAGLGLVGVANLLLKWSPFRNRRICFAWGFALPLAAGLYWENVALLYRGGTADPLDLVASSVGGMMAWAALRSVWRGCSFEGASNNLFSPRHCEYGVSVKKRATLESGVSN